MLCGWHNHRSSGYKHANIINPDINRNSEWKESTQGNAWLKTDRDRYDASFARTSEKKYYGEETLSCTWDGTCHECIPTCINNNNNPIQPPFIEKMSSELLTTFTTKDDYTIPATGITIKRSIYSFLI